MAQLALDLVCLGETQLMEKKYFKLQSLHVLLFVSPLPALLLLLLWLLLVCCCCCCCCRCCCCCVVVVVVVLVVVIVIVIVLVIVVVVVVAVAVAVAVVVTFFSCIGIGWNSFLLTKAPSPGNKMVCRRRCGYDGGIWQDAYYPQRKVNMAGFEPLNNGRALVLFLSWLLWSVIVHIYVSCLCIIRKFWKFLNDESAEHMKRLWLICRPWPGRPGNGQSIHLGKLKCHLNLTSFTGKELIVIWTNYTWILQSGDEQFLPTIWLLEASFRPGMKCHDYILAHGDMFFRPFGSLALLYFDWKRLQLPDMTKSSKWGVLTAAGLLEYIFHV